MSKNEREIDDILRDMDILKLSLINQLSSTKIMYVDLLTYYNTLEALKVEYQTALLRRV